MAEKTSAETFIGLGEWVKQRRRTLDLTQDELARQVGCSKITIRKIEAEERRPSKQVAERLADVLGIAPDDRQAFIRFARGDPRAALTAQAARGHTPVPWQAPTGNLPAAPTPLIGRAAELAELQRHLADPRVRLLTLIGPGGIGKTHLALQAAAESGPGFAEGVYFVPLAPLASPDFIVSAIANALKFSFNGPLDSKTQLFNYLGDRPMLVVLDNFEHLLAGTAVIAELLAHAPKVRLLVTSRERLNLQGEWLFEVNGLRVPADDTPGRVEDFSAVQLFLQCARRIQPGFDLSAGELPAVVRICRLVEGLPLGIELAAAWLRALSGREIAAEIERNLEFLTSQRRDIPERHRSLTAVFEHSWKLLAEDERRALRALSVFRGGFEREAAESVAGASLPVLAALVDKSLVRHTGAGRYELHELWRQYASEKLSEAGETESGHRRQRDWCLALAAEVYPAPPALWGTTETARLNRLEAERDNLRAALAWSMQNGQAEERLRLAGLLVWFWYVRSYFSEGRRWLEQALAASEGASAPVLASVLQGAGVLAEQQGDFENAVGWLNQALVLHRENKHVEAGWVVLDLSQIAVEQGRYDEAMALYAEAAALFKELGNQNHLASLQMYWGIAACRQGDYERAESLLEESLPTLRKIGDKLAVARALHALGLVARHRRDLGKAGTLFKESLTLSDEIGARLEVAQCLEGLAGVAFGERSYQKAARLHGAAEALRQAVGTPVPSDARAGYDREVSSLRERLGDIEFNAAWAEGGHMTMAQSIAEVLGE